MQQKDKNISTSTTWLISRVEYSARISDPNQARLGQPVSLARTIINNFLYVKVARYSFKTLSCSLLDMFFFVLLNLNKFVLNYSCILTFGLSNYNSFGDQCFVAMATVSYEIHSKMMYCCVGKKEAR